MLLVSGWFCLSKTIIPDAQEHFLTPSPRRNTHLFGGLGIRLAIVDGPRQAAQAFHKAVTGSSTVVHRYFLLSGFRIEEPIEVFDGVTLLPIFDDASDLPSFVPMLESMPDDHHRFSVQYVLGKTVVRAETEISPVFHRPEPSYTFDSMPDAHFRMKLRSNEISDLDLVRFGEALSLANRRSVRNEMDWAALPDYDIFDCSPVFSLGGNGYRAVEPVVHLERPAELTVARLDTIKTLYRALQELPTDEFNKLRIPIDRWMKSKVRLILYQHRRALRPAYSEVAAGFPFRLG